MFYMSTFRKVIFVIIIIIINILYFYISLKILNSETEKSTDQSYYFSFDLYLYF